MYLSISRALSVPIHRDLSKCPGCDASKTLFPLVVSIHCSFPFAILDNHHNSKVAECPDLSGRIEATVTLVVSIHCSFHSQHSTTVRTLRCLGVSRALSVPIHRDLSKCPGCDASKPQSQISLLKNFLSQFWEKLGFAFY